MAKRRNMGIRYDRYAAAIAASAVYNCNRASEDSPVVHPFDFIRDEESAKKLEKVREGKRYIKKVVGGLPMTTPRSKFLEIRRKAIADLTASKFENAEAMFDEVWPHLKPTKEESGA